MHGHGMVLSAGPNRSSAHRRLRSFRAASGPGGVLAASLRFDQRVEPDAGVEAHRLQHEHQVLGRDVAACARRIRTTAKSAERGIERADAGFECRDDVGKAGPARVVEMRRAEPIADGGPHPREQAAHLRGARIPDRIGDPDPSAPAATLAWAIRTTRLLGYLALDRAAERGRHAARGADGRAASSGLPRSRPSFATISSGVLRTLARAVCLR